MKVTIKTLQADSYQASSAFIDAEPTDSIGVIKSKIEESQGFSAHLQKIVFSGELLKDDDRTLESYGFSEDRYLILMVNQKNKTKAPVLGVPSTSNSILGHGDGSNAAGPRSITTPSVKTSTVFPATAGPSKYPGALVPYSAQSSTPPSAVLNRP
ncbi:hypothetical protein K435DRAFT_971507, partial [Dendrothele bispora CBS 962.96]